MNLPLDATGVVQSDDLIKRKRAVKVPVASVYLPIYLPELFWRIITCRVDLSIKDSSASIAEETILSPNNSTGFLGQDEESQHVFPALAQSIQHYPGASRQKLSHRRANQRHHLPMDLYRHQDRSSSG